MCRDPETQLQLLDGIAGTTQAAAAFGEQWAQLKRLREQVAAAQELADPAEREAKQALFDEVSILFLVLAAGRASN